MQHADETDSQIIEKLNMVIRLLAHNVAMQHGTLESKAVALSSLGLKPTDIARVCGTTPLTISVRLSEAKKKDKKKSKKKS